MPAELRFCRNCGFRLGEVFAEYSEPVRYDRNQAAAIHAAGGMPAPVRRRRRMSGMTWIFVALLVFFIGAAAFTAVVTPRRDRPVTFTTPIAKSFIGVDGFDTSDDGVTFENTDCPGGPADKAGLVGGDVITSFDGQAIHDEDQLNDLLVKTPIGKTVDVVYLRDGETKTTKLTTISREEFDRLNNAFNKRPEGRGQLGFDDGDIERVPIPGTKMFGVKLGSILQSRPADLAGIKEGDIVMEFDGVPIRSTDEFRVRVRRALPYSTVKVVVMRGDQKLEIPVKMGRQ
jgi:S1-C subfamily serine protease